LITTSKELETSLKAKMMELSGIESQLIHMKKVHSKVVKESEEK